MQSVSSRIWTRVAVSISYDDNVYTTGTSIHIYNDDCRILTDKGHLNHLTYNLIIMVNNKYNLWKIY